MDLERHVTNSSLAMTRRELSNPMKARIKKALKTARARYRTALHSFSPEDLERAIGRLGLAGGDTVMVHSAFDAFQGFRGRPSEVLTVLQRVVTDYGTLILPTLPFAGTALGYAESGPVFDPLRTPSRTGLLTEIFRRMPGVVRSIHPTHAVAAWGRDAEVMTSEHWRAKTPCGADSPYARLLERNGKILLLGADVSSLTFFHTLEEFLETVLPVSPFTSQRYVLRSRLPDGRFVETETRLFDPDVSKRRNLYKLVPRLKRGGKWRQTRVGGVVITLLLAGDILECVRTMAEEGAYCYD